MKTTPEAACGRLPLEGATPVAWPSQFRGVADLALWPVSILAKECTS